MLQQVAGRMLIGHAALPRVPTAASFDGLPRTWRTRLRRLPSIMRAASMMVLAAGLSGLAAPWGGVQPRGLDVLMLVDVSQSMRAQDAVPDRLGAATAFAREVIAGRPRDRFGVLLFAGDDALACPLTSDHAAVLARLSVIEASSGSGTAIGTAMLAALKRLPADRDDAVLLLFTDGSSNAGVRSPAEAAALVRRENVRVFTIGVGRTGLALFPTEAGLVDVSSEVDEHALEAMADAADGVFVRAGDPGAVGVVTEALGRVPVTAPPSPAHDMSTAVQIGVLAALLLALELIVAVLVLRERS